MGNFNVGDTVQLRAGGPKMTIDEIDMSGRAYCKWFSGGKLQKDYFESHSLNKVEETNE